MNNALTLTAVFLCATAVAAVAETINFDSDTPGLPPPGWTATATGKGAPRWTVEKDATAPSRPCVLKQSRVASYPVCLKNGSRLKDGTTSVRFKTLDGKEDQAAGLIWRARDANNYYVARANALEDNVTIYHTVNGKRTEKKRVTMKVSPREWHTLRVTFSGPQFRVYLDNQLALEWEDQTFKEAGEVGLWTKADSTTLFDDFTFTAAD